MKWLLITCLTILFISGVYASCDETQIDINTASAEELDKITWVGPATANNIIAYRENDVFDSVDELINVNGIGEKKLADIKGQGLACVEEESEETVSEESPEDQTEEVVETEEEYTEERLEEESAEIGVLTFETIELGVNSKDIKSEDNKENLKRNLAFAGIVTFCTIFSGALFLSNIRKRKNEFN